MLCCTAGVPLQWLSLHAFLSLSSPGPISLANQRRLGVLSGGEPDESYCPVSHPAAVLAQINARSVTALCCITLDSSPPPPPLHPLCFSRSHPPLLLHTHTLSFPHSNTHSLSVSYTHTFSLSLSLLLTLNLLLSSLSSPSFSLSHSVTRGEASSPEYK